MPKLNSLSCNEAEPTSLTGAVSSLEPEIICMGNMGGY